nr:MAG TPA: hypothetical protein [Caudoviricetes sp.]
MPKIDESKLADILNSLLTENIKAGENLIQDFEKSVNNFNKNVKDFSSTINFRAEEVGGLVAALKSAPKISKTLKLSSLAASFAVGAAFSAALFAYPLSSITYKYIQANKLTQKYDELERYALTLEINLKAFEKTVQKTLKPENQGLFDEIFLEELRKIKEESK